MDVREVKLAKAGLERKVAALLDEFEQETRAKITSVDIQQTAEKNMFLDSRHNVVIRIEL